MLSYQYRKSHCGDKTILRPSYLHNGISYTGKMTYLCWIRALDWYWPVLAQIFHHIASRGYNDFTWWHMFRQYIHILCHLYHRNMSHVWNIRNEKTLTYTSINKVNHFDSGESATQRSRHSATMVFIYFSKNILVSAWEILPWKINA